MKKNKKRWNRKGFTLIESIITLVLVSVMAAMLLTFMQPLYNSLGAFSWFNDELILQQSMERIMGDYKSLRNDPNNTFDPGVFRQYVITNYPLSVVARTGFLTFTCSGTAPNITCTAGSLTATIPSGAPPVLVITVQKNAMILSMILT